MTLTALEEHLLPADPVDQVWPTAMAPEALAAKLADVDALRLRAMDDAGIDVQVLSVTAPGSQEVPTEAATELSRALNDRCAEAIAANPDRFNALATLPTQDPGAAIAEANRRSPSWDSAVSSSTATQRESSWMRPSSTNYSRP
jgi:predicted TIM-barrel fold metal-dependent hydrolase